MVPEMYFGCCAILTLLISCWFGIRVFISTLLLGFSVGWCVNKYIRACMPSISNSELEVPSSSNNLLIRIGESIHHMLFVTALSLVTERAKRIFYVIKAIIPVRDDVAREHIVPFPASVKYAPQHCGEEISVKNEIGTIVDCVLREYMKNWYHTKISSDVDFINDVDSILHNALTSLCNSMANADTNKLLCHLLQVYIHFLHHFKKSVSKVSTDESILQICVEKKEQILQNFEMHHWALKDKTCEWSYLQSVMKRLIDSHGPKVLTSSLLLHTVSTEILTQNIMYPMINVLTDSHRLNSWISKLMYIALKLEVDEHLGGTTERGGDQVSNAAKDNKNEINSAVTGHRDESRNEINNAVTGHGDESRNEINSAVTGHKDESRNEIDSAVTGHGDEVAAAATGNRDQDIKGTISSTFEANNTVPQIFIPKETSTEMSLLGTTLETADNRSDLCTNFGLSGSDNSIGNTSGKDTSFGATINSSGSIESDILIASKTSTLQGPFFHTEDTEQKEVLTNVSYPVIPPMKLRACSNVSVINACEHNESENTSAVPSQPEALNMKRSKSADFISHMAASNTLIPVSSPQLNIRYCDKTNKSFIQLKSDTVSSDEIDIAEEAVEKELPPLISDIKIVGTVEQDIGHNPYTLYLIQYNGLFQNAQSESQNPDFVQQEVNIKRRFREFLALQSRLEGNLVVKAHLKGIKGLSRWLATPFTHFDKKHVGERRVLLEIYLKELCKRDAIVNSPELQEFLGYGKDATIAFVKKPVDLSLPRIDKLIVRGVKGAIDLFRTALPGSSGVNTKETSKKTHRTAANEDSSSENKIHPFLIDYTKRGPDILKDLESFLENREKSFSANIISHDYFSPATSSRCTSLLQNDLSITSQDGCDCTGTIFDSDQSLEENSLAHLILDIIVEMFPGKTVVFDLLKCVPISFLQSFVENKLQDLTEEKCAPLLHLLHRALWPEIKSMHKYQCDPKLAIVLRERMNEYLEKVSSTSYCVQLLKNAFGEEDIILAIEYLLGSIQVQELNRCLLFHAFDVIVQDTFSEEQ